MTRNYYTILYAALVALLGACAPTVETAIHVDGVSIAGGDRQLEVGGTLALSATVSPANADEQGLRWSSSDASVASVSAGTLSALAVGRAVITVTTVDQGKTASVTVTVTDRAAALRGTVYDDYSALPLPGATVAFGGSSAVSAEDGSFSVALAASSGTLTGDFSAYKAGYSGQFVASVSVDAANPPDLSMVPLHPLDTAAYATRTISGKIYAAGGAELAAGTRVKLTVMRNGLYGGPAAFDYVSGGFTVQTPVFGQDCLVVVKTDASQLSGSFGMRKEIDLRASETALDLTLAAADTIAVSGSAAGAYALPFLKGGYGAVSGLYTEMAAATGAAPLTNPLGFRVVWGSYLRSSEAGFDTTKIAFGESQAQAASMTVPSVAACPGFTDPAASASAVYDGSTGSLSFDASSGADCYRVRVSGGDFPEDVEFASFSTSLALPAWLRSALDSKSGEITVTSLAFAELADTHALGLLLGWHVLAPEGLVYSQVNDDGATITF